MEAYSSGLDPRYLIDVDIPVIRMVALADAWMSNAISLSSDSFAHEAAASFLRLGRDANSATIIASSRGCFHEGLGTLFGLNR
jgi:hypothetical protein